MKEKQDIALHFNLMESDKAIVIKLLAYFLKDQFICDKYQIELKKGILLSAQLVVAKLH